MPNSPTSDSTGQQDRTQGSAACDICANTGTDYIGRPCRRCRPGPPIQEFFTISRPMLEALVRASKSYYGTPGPGKERPHANSCGCGICEARRWAEGVLNGT